MYILIYNLFSLIIFAAVVVITVGNHARMEWAFFHCSYYIILFLSLIWVYSIVNLWRKYQPNAVHFLKAHARGIVFSLICTTIVFVSVPKYYRVLSDETNLLSVARSMTFEKQVRNINEARSYYEMFFPTFWSYEKRPFLFPFFVSIVHTLCGYRVANVFGLNFAALWGVLFLLYMLIRFYLGEMMAFASIILVIAQPIICLSATSASCEIFNLLFILASLLSLRFFLKNPSSSALLVLVFNLTLLSNIRYESGIFLVIVLFMLGIRGHLRMEFLKSKFLTFLPFFFLPWLWQRILTVNDGDLPGGTWLNAFKFDYIFRNLNLFHKFVFDLSGNSGYAGIINVAGLLAFLYLFLSLLKKVHRLSKEQETFLVILIVSVFISFSVPTLYHAAISDHPMNGRFYFPVLVVLSILPVFCLAEIIQENARWMVLAAAIISFIYYHPIAMEDRVANNLFIIREFRFVDDFLKKHADKNSLIICGRPVQLIVDNYGAIYYSTANSEVNTILEQYKNHLYSTIYAVQAISYTTQSPLDFSVIDPRYKLVTMDELQITGDYYFRISRVIPPHQM